jgi:hydrogenase maturation protein HypF
LGVALDGTGYGTDHSIWGGELLFLPDLGRFERVAHLKPFLLPGGDACIRAPRRTALSVVQEYLGAPAVEQAIAFLDVPETEANAVKQMVQRRVGTIPTTSCGRLFDAVAALCGLGQRVTYEGQPAMELEFLAARYINHININTNHKIDNKIGIEVDINQIEPYPFALELMGGEVLVIDPSLALAQILDELSQGKERGLIAAKFHLGLVDGWARACDQVARARGVQGVVLGGGCFQNQLLLEYFIRKLEQQGLVAYLPRRIPVNDGGIALGQAAVFAAQRLRPKD